MLLFASFVCVTHEPSIPMPTIVVTATIVLAVVLFMTGPSDRNNNRRNRRKP